MPAKKVTANRTKGNVKPSSSSQAAQLLTASGQAPTGFIGFSSQPAFVPASEILEDVDYNLDSDFRLILRKFSKRDTTTKIKALHEFSSLCNDKDEECVKAVVPFWSRIYNKLAIDFDHKVRELSQNALSMLASKAGKSIAPQLKVIMGTWLVSQCDSYPTVASAATSSFETTFPGTKKTDALRFCKDEIMQCLLSNILKQTPQTLSDPLTTDAEDMESKYQRVVASSLQATRKLMFSLSSKCVESITPQLTELLNSGAFWKHTKSTVPLIKTGALSLLSAVCQLCPIMSAQFLSKICPLVISCLNSPDPSLMAQSWEAILSVVHTHKNCWEYVNWQKAVWPALKSVLESGCSGQATVISPCFLPLLSTLPEKNFAQFFDAFRLGLNEDSVLNSPSACSALVRSFIECIKYSLKYIADSGSEQKLSDSRSIIEDQMMVVVNASLTHPKPALSRTELYSLMGSVLTLINDLDPDSEESIWTDLSSFVLSHLMLQYKPPDEQTDANSKNPGFHIFQRLPLLATGIVYQQSYSPSKRERVSFVQTDKDPAVKLRSPAKEKQAMSVATEKFYSDIIVASYTMSTLKGPRSPQFFNLFKELTVMHVPQAAAERLLSGKKDKTVQDFLSDLNLFDTYVSPQCSCDTLAYSLKISLKLSDETNATAHWKFLCNHILELLVDGTEGGAMTSDVVTVFFTFVSHVEEEKAAELLMAILNGLQQVPALCQFIKDLLSHAAQIPACRRLVEGHAVGARIEKLTTSLTSDSNVLGSSGVSGALWQMLTAALNLAVDGTGLLVSKSCLDAILSLYIATLKQMFTSQTQSTGEDILSVVRMAHAAFEKSKLASHPQLNELLMTLFSIRLQASDWDTDTEQEFDSVVEAGLRHVLESCTFEERDERLMSVCTVIQQYLRDSLHNVTGLSRVTKAVEILTASAANVVSSENDSDSPLTTLFDQLLIDTDVLNISQEQQVFEYLYVNGNLPHPPRPEKIKSSQPFISLESYALLNLHNLRIMNKMAEQSGGKLDLTYNRLWLFKYLGNLTHAYVLTHYAYQIKTLILTENDVILEELRTGVIRHMTSLTKQQISDVISNYIGSSVEKLCVFKMLAGQENELSAVSKGFVEKQTQSLPFLGSERCTELGFRGELKGILTHPVTGKAICQAFNLSCSAILNCTEPNMENIADCIFSFVELTKDLDLMTEEVKCEFYKQLIDLVKQLKEKDIHLLTGGGTNNSDVIIQLNTVIAQSLTVMMVSHHEAYWEFSLCTLVEWIQYISEIDLHSWIHVNRKAFLVSVCELAHKAATTFAAAPVDTEKSEDSQLDCVTEKSKTEWDEFFCEGVFSLLVDLFIRLSTDEYLAIEGHWDVVLTSLSCAASLCPATLLKNHQLPAHLTISDTSLLPDSLKTLLNHLSPLLMSRHSCVQLSAYRLLSSVIEEIPSHEAVVIKEDTEEEEVRPPPEALVQTLHSTGHYLDALMVVSVGEQVVMEAGSEEQAQTRGYLLTWTLLLQLFRCAPNLLRAKYAGYFKSHDSVNHLLDYLFRLMPEQPSSSLLELSFSQDISEKVTSLELPTLALCVYRHCLETLPALVRLWWVDQDRKSSNFVDRFTIEYLSTDLILHQISASSSTTTNMEGITIRARPALREVSATYEMSEVSVTLTITLPENFPLGRLDVSCDRRVGVSQGQWDRWLMQLNIFLQHQNGNIEEGLRLWKGNIDKKVEGIEDCMICFSVIHGTTFQLPRLSCKTCHKKYHSACLYKWFSTSQKSSCPLCRNLF